MSTLIRKILQERFLDESIELDEASFRDIKDEPVGSTVHPYRQHSRYGGSVSYTRPLTVAKHLDTKTVVHSEDGDKYDVSHKTGAVKKRGGLTSTFNHGPHGYHTPEEKAAHDEHKQKQIDKDHATDAIHAHLAGIKNSYGNAVGKLSDEDHAAILQHLEKLRK